ncbi:MAG TPA: hypothetical protein PKN33_12780 [Phycisphaerae bacterium]|nr:hypothetical protein [Phycisphaerae bacterium]
MRALTATMLKLSKRRERMPCNYTDNVRNRLVKATLDVEGDQGGSLKDVTIHENAFDGLGRRVVKTVSNSGDLDGVTEYYHNKNQIIEPRDGSGNLETQVYPKMQKTGDCPERH